MVVTAFKLLSGLLIAASVSAVSAAPQQAPAPAAAIPVFRIDHVGMNVPDMSAAIEFFQELFGARVVLDVQPIQATAEWKSRFRWHASSRIERFSIVELSSGDRLELFQYAGEQVSDDQPHQDDAGASHIALRVSDVDASLAIVRKRGLRVLNEPDGGDVGFRWFYFLTPWGSQLELVAPSPPTLNKGADHVH